MDANNLRRRLDSNSNSNSNSTGDGATRRHLPQAMCSDLTEQLQQLQQPLQARDTDLAIAHAHGLKGSLGSMTADNSARLSKGPEPAADSRDGHLFARSLPLLMKAEAHQIDAALAAQLSVPPPAA